MPFLDLKLDLMIGELLAVNDLTLRSKNLEDIIREAVASKDLKAFTLNGTRGREILLWFRVDAAYDAEDGPSFVVSSGSDERLRTADPLDRFADAEPAQGHCPIWKHACKSFMRAIAKHSLHPVVCFHFHKRATYYSATYNLSNSNYIDKTGGVRSWESENSNVSNLHASMGWAPEIS